MPGSAKPIVFAGGAAWALARIGVGLGFQRVFQCSSSLA